MAQSKPRAWGSVTCADKFLARRWWEPVGRKCYEAREPVLAGVRTRLQSELAHSVGMSSCSSAAGKMGLPHRAWANSFVLISSCFSTCSVTAAGKQCFPSSQLCCGGVSPACQDGAEPDQVDVCLQPCRGQLVLVSGKQSVRLIPVH